MNVLLSGGTVYIRSHTATVLSQFGYQVSFCDNLSNSRDSVLEKLIRITTRKILFTRGDVRDTELLRSTLTSHKIDAVIHFAGLKSIG